MDEGEWPADMKLRPVVCITRGRIGVAGLFDVLPLDDSITAPEGQETGKEEGNADAPPPAPDALPAAPTAMACKAATTSLSGFPRASGDLRYLQQWHSTSTLSMVRAFERS